MNDKYPHKLQFNDAARKRFDRIAALLDLDDWNNAITYSGNIALQHAEQAVKGNTAMFARRQNLISFTKTTQSSSRLSAKMA
jgi:predicted aminopeptidase